MSKWVDAEGNNWRFSRVGGFWQKQVAPDAWINASLPNQGLKRSVSSGAAPGATVVETMGPQGLKGDKGDRGDQGVQGIQGIQGDQGDPGTPADPAEVQAAQEAADAAQALASTARTAAIAAQAAADQAQAAADAASTLAGTKYSKPPTGIPGVDLADAVQASLNLADTVPTKYVKPTGGVPKGDLAAAVQASLTAADSATQGGYIKPGGGIPKPDLTTGVQASLTAADSATQGGYLKPGTGIPNTDLAAGVQTSLGKADSALQSVTKADIGLGSVDNTADVAKPISTSTQAALDAKQNSLGFTAENVANKGVANGYAPLGSDVRVPSAFLPSYVDRVQSYVNLAGFPATGSTAIIYIAEDTGKEYRWNTGITNYSEISKSPGSTDEVAEGTLNKYYTDIRADDRVAAWVATYGPYKATDAATALNLKADLASPTFTGTVSGITKAMVGLNLADNTSDATKNAAVATLTNKTISGASNTLTNATGTLLPVQALTDGSETYTIAAGTVTQITGTSICVGSGGTYAPSIGDRILVWTAPVSSGVGSTYTATTNPGNGVYVVTGNTTNLSLSRAADMSGSVNPSGLSVYSENPSGWSAHDLFTVTTPSSSAAFTYGTGGIQFAAYGGASPAPVSMWLTGGLLSLQNAGYVAQLLPGSGGSVTRNLTLPTPIANDTMVSRTSTDTLTNKTLTNPVLGVPKVDMIRDTNNVANLAIGAAAGAVNYLQTTNAVTTAAPQISAAGSDTNISFNLVPKGTGRVQAGGVNIPTISSADTLTNKTLTTPKIDTITDTTNGLSTLGITPQASAVNYFTMKGAAASGSPWLTGAGSDTNVGINLATKGNGQISIWAPTGQVPTVSGQGADANHDLNLTAKGTGKVRVNSAQILTVPATTFQDFIGGTPTSGSAVNLTGQAWPVGAIGFDIYMIGCGIGGGSGRRGAPATVRCGGGGGAGTMIMWARSIRIADCGATWDLAIPLSGTGGAARTTDDTDGNPAASAGIIVFSSGALVVRVYNNGSGTTGKGGTATNGLAGTTAAVGGMITGGGGAAASTTGGVGASAPPSHTGGNAGAGAGGGISTANVAAVGGAGGFSGLYAPTAKAAGGAAGITDSTLPTAGDPALPCIPGDGTGGGAASITTAAQAGANGVGYGAAGGGGGASTNGFNSGKGGDGGPGFVRITWIYS